ncbi:MAG: hypothetical protein IJB19_00185 [Clostridia bacterium]|nr:hypothetical protein [Clostridia bacterium]
MRKAHWFGICYANAKLQLRIPTRSKRYRVCPTGFDYELRSPLKMTPWGCTAQDDAGEMCLMHIFRE